MRYFMVKWTKSLFGTQVLAHDEAEARAIAEEHNDNRPSDRSFGEVKSVKLIRGTPGVIGYGL